LISIVDLYYVLLFACSNTYTIVVGHTRVSVWILVSANHS